MNWSAMMKQVVEALRSGTLPSMDDLSGSIESVVPRFVELDQIPQDREWHGEGNVRVHTEMVLEQVFQLIANGAEPLSEEERVGLVFGAALHDIGKVFTTREEKIEGVTRIVSPHHTERGRSHVGPLLGEAGLTIREIQLVLGLIRHHHDPRKLVLRSAQRNRYARLARAVSHRMLYLMERCDLEGRICRDKESQLETLELFRMESGNLGLWDCRDPYREWKDRVASTVPEEEGRSYVIGEMIREYERGCIQSPEEAIARTWEHRREHGSVIVLSAPSGSGKSTWTRNRAPGDSTIISLDQIREELTGKRSDQSKNGQVLQRAREQLRKALRAKRTVVWDATSLRRDGRAMVLDLAHNYHAATRIVTMGVAPEIIAKRNQDRKEAVPPSVVRRQFNRWQWPDTWEAHQVDWVYP